MTIPIVLIAVASWSVGASGGAFCLHIDLGNHLEVATARGRMLSVVGREARLLSSASYAPRSCSDVGRCWGGAIAIPTVITLRGAAVIWPVISPAAVTAGQTGTVVLDNEYVRVTRNAAACAAGASAGCGDRVIVALGDTELRSGGDVRKMGRGDVAVFTAGQAYLPPAGGPFLEVAIKPEHPPVQRARERLPAEKNLLRYDGERFFIFEERLDPGETRARHSHNQRVVVQLNRTQLRQWPDGEPEILRDIVPDGATFNPPVIHTAKNVGQLPLRGIVIEFK